MLVAGQAQDMDDHLLLIQDHNSGLAVAEDFHGVGHALQERRSPILSMMAAPYVVQ